MGEGHPPRLLPLCITLLHLLYNHVLFSSRDLPQDVGAVSNVEGFLLHAGPNYPHNDSLPFHCSVLQKGRVRSTQKPPFLCSALLRTPFGTTKLFVHPTSHARMNQSTNPSFIYPINTAYTYQTYSGFWKYFVGKGLSSLAARRWHTKCTRQTCQVVTRHVREPPLAANSKGRL